MKNLYQQIKEFIKFNYPFIIAGIILLVLVITYGADSGDYSVHFRDNALKLSLFEFIDTRIGNGRWLVDGVGHYIFSHFIKIFYVCVIGSTVLLLNSITKLLRIKDVNFNILLSTIFILSFNAIFIKDVAGPIAIMTNYLLPASALAYGCLVLINKSNFILKYIAIFYAVNMEQFALFAFIVFGANILFNLFAKIRIKKELIIAFCISAFGMLWAAFSSKNLNRTGRNLDIWFPGFNDMSLFQKLDTGFIATMNELFISPSFIVIIFILTILIIALIKRKLIAASLSFGVISMLLFPELFNFIIVRINVLILSWSNTSITSDGHPGFISQTSLSDYTTLLPDIYFIFMTLIVLIALWQILKTNRERFMIFSVLAAGFISRMLMSFSPTLFGSGSRTFIILFLSIFIINAYLIKENLFVYFCEKQNHKRKVDVNSTRISTEKHPL